MKRWMFAALLLTPPALGLVADDKPKSEKKPVETFTDPAKAGPDFAFQGEYVGTHKDRKADVQVIALGDGKFHIKAHFGGLPGDGWSGDPKATTEFDGKLEDGKV